MALSLHIPGRRMIHPLPALLFTSPFLSPFSSPVPQPPSQHPPSPTSISITAAKRFHRGGACSFEKKALRWVGTDISPRLITCVCVCGFPVGRDFARGVLVEVGQGRGKWGGVGEREEGWERGSSVLVVVAGGSRIVCCRGGWTGVLA